MRMSHIRGQSRDQAILFPEALDDLIPADHPVRVIDAFVDGLELSGLGFTHAQAAPTGRPPYDPGDLLKLYVYGYLNQVRSSRRLEREAKRNIEVLWLLNRLAPDFKTIADFRKDNGGAIVGVCRAFIRFCKDEGLFGAELVAIDSSKFQAAASRKQVMTPRRIEREVKRVEARIVMYLKALDDADAAELSLKAGPSNTRAALAALRKRQAMLQAQAVQMQAQGEKQHVKTEPEARLMRGAHGQHRVAYNVQTAVDGKHGLIISHAVCNEGNDHRQLCPMATAAQAELKAKRLTVVADVGYQNGEHGAACEAQAITPVVPAQRPVNPRGRGFDKSAFKYGRDTDTYCCPAGEHLTCRRTDHRVQVRYYTTDACGACGLRPQCTQAKRRTISRHFYADYVEVMNARAADHPELMVQRRCLSEHPFGTIKRMMGDARFVMRGLKHVATEMSLSVTAYNLMRVINILGVPQLLARLSTKTALAD
jgi:transposase